MRAAFHTCRLLAAAVLALAPAAVLTAHAAASSSRPGPSSLAIGLSDDWAFELPPESVRVFWFDQAQQIGTRWVRIDVYWRLVAPLSPPAGFNAANPGDPSYNWSYVDAAVRDAAARHIRILLTIVEPPDWALGPGAPASAAPHTWNPSPAALGEFARALAERYSGQFPDPLNPGQTLPRVSHYQALNEPNLPTTLSPQWVRHGRRYKAESPVLYRSLLNAVYENVKAVQPHAYVLAAGTAPYGDPPGLNRMPPVVFWRTLLCLRGKALRPEHCPDPAHFDAIDHHPYAFDPTIHAFSPLDASVTDIGRLARIVHAAQRSGRALPRGRKAIWVTEIDWSSSPPLHGGLPLRLQARYVSLAFYELWRQDVSHVFWMLIRDYPFETLWGGGLYFANGQAKPSAAAFSFPFVAVPSGRGEVAIWGRSPRGGGTVTIERRAGHRWTRLLRLRATRGGIFYAVRPLSQRLFLRAVNRSATSASWSIRGAG